MPKKVFISKIPNFSEFSINSFCWFLEKGLPMEIRKFASLLDFTRSHDSRLLIYSDEYLLRKPGCSPTQCKNYGLSYSVRINLPLTKIIDGKASDRRMFFGEIPLMTDNGTFIINGVERIVINQIIRSPGAYFKLKTGKRKIPKYIATLISIRGNWLNFEYCPKTRNVVIRLNKDNVVDLYQVLKICGVNGIQLPHNVRLIKPKLKRIRVIKQNLNCNTDNVLYKELAANFDNKRFFKGARLTMEEDHWRYTVTKIFKKKNYNLGLIGRKKMNQKFGLSTSLHVTAVTLEDIIAISNYLILLYEDNKFVEFDDIDHLKNRRIRSVGELIQLQISIGMNRLSRSVCERIVLLDKYYLSQRPIIAAIKEFFVSSQLSQFMDQTNAIATLTHRRRISSLGPGGLNRDRLSLSVRDIHPSQYGRICPIETPEGQNAGLLVSLASYARINESGFLEAPFFLIKEGNILDMELPIYLTTEEEDKIPIVTEDVLKNNLKQNLKRQLIPIRQKNEYNAASFNELKLVSVSPIQNFSIATSLVPFLEHDDANRALMGSNMQRQSVPLLYPSKPIVGTGLEHQLVTDSGTVIVSKHNGTVKYVSAQTISIETEQHEIVNYHLQKFTRSNQATCINQRPIVWPYEIISSGQIISDGPGTCEGELALGQNLLVAYMPWEGYNYEDAVLISNRLIQEDIFTSVNIEKFDLEVCQTDLGVEKITRYLPNINSDDDYIKNLDTNGIIYLGQFVTPGDILIGKVTPSDGSEQLPEGRLLNAIFGGLLNGYDSSLRVPKGINGRVINIRIFRNSPIDKFEQEEDIALVNIFIATKRKIKIGDKIAGRHGNKGIISRIIPQHDMPFLPNGIPIDILLSPLGVPSRMNIGQIFECLLGLAGSKLKRRFKIRPFDEMYGIEMSRKLVNFYLQKASHTVKEPWLFNQFSPGRITLRDGRNGSLFENPALVGQTYMLKLIHQVDDKIHARSTGPYSLITQQPLKGKAKRGGQRFGEMEVWALQAFGCAYTLQELLTLKSDDMEGRNEVVNAIVKGLPMPEPGIPESFKVLIRELHSLGLDVSFYKMSKESFNSRDEREIDLLRKYEQNLNKNSFKDEDEDEDEDS